MEERVHHRAEPEIHAYPMQLCCACKNIFLPEKNWSVAEAGDEHFE